MASWIEHVDIDEDFFEVNKQFKYISPFNELASKKNGSKLMWAVFLYCDPSKKNKIGRMPEEEKKKEIAKNYIKDKTFKWKTLEPYIEAYIEKMMTQEERLLVTWEKNLKMFDAFISKNMEELENMDLDDAKKLQGLLKESKPTWDKYLEVKAEFDKTQEEGRVMRKGQKESASERGDL